MLFNCFHCGKSISTRKDICVYCKTDVSQLVKELNLVREKGQVKEHYAGTLLSFLMKAKSTPQR